MEGYNFVLWYFLLCQSSFTSHGGLRLEMFIFRTRRRIVRDEDLGEGGGTYTCTKPKNFERKKELEKHISGGWNSSNWDIEQRQEEE